MSKISVIVPVYNVETYLPRCLDSLLIQTFSDFEIICINDGSLDNCDKILKDYAKKDKRIKLIDQENQGLSGARNTGLNNARGEYIVFLDSDDYLPSFALEVFIKIALESKADVIVSDKMINLSKNESVQIPLEIKWQIHNNPLADILNSPKIFSSVCNKMYRADILQKKRFIQGIYFEDWPFITTFFGIIKNYASTPTPLYYYDDTIHSIMRSEFSVKKIYSYMTGIRYVFDFYKNTKNINLAKKRIAIAVRMCVNKTYRDKNNLKILAPVLTEEVQKLFFERIVCWWNLSIKTLYRLWKMK